MIKDNSNWFASWFNTPFYHILYKERDHTEAETFMHNLTNYLNIPEGGKILDLACGRGRHAIYLNSIGYDVTGVDLSEKSIAFAKQFENETLHFAVHDMCKPYNEKFDAVFNLFTSFGYFEKDEDNLRTIKAIKADLSEYGFGVIDFMNSDFVINNIVPQETKIIDDIEFKLQRYVDNNHIIKDISFSNDGSDYEYQERVRAFNLNDFKQLFEEAEVDLLDIFGDYKLSKFDANESSRLIMIFK